jgi:hypothetical protein
LSKTVALRSNHKDCGGNMMKEFAVFASALEKIATASGHHTEIGMQVCSPVDQADRRRSTTYLPAKNLICLVVN